MNVPATQTPDIEQRLRDAVAAADERKAIDVCVLDLSEVSDFTDYFMVCTGRTDRQVGAIAEAIQRSLRDQGARPLHVEGERTARWVLLDYGDFVIHVFDAELRQFYALERLWADAPNVTEALRG